MALPTYQAGDARAYCHEKNWVFREASGGHLLLAECPFCAKKDKFYLNDENGFWDCKVCAKKGGFFSLKKEFGDLTVRANALQPKPVAKRTWSLDKFQAFEQALADSPEAIAYLESRGLTLATAKAWHLGYKHDGKGWLMIPYISGGKIADVKYRTIPPAEKAYRRSGGGDSILFGEHRLQEDAKAKKPKTLYLCEGELDALTLWQNGYSPVLSTTAGAGTFKDRWYQMIQDFQPERIYVIYDSDPVGQDGAAKLVKRLDDFDVRNVALPEFTAPDGGQGKDINEYFRVFTNADFDDLLAASQPPGDVLIHSIYQVMDQLETEMFLLDGELNGIPSMFPDINAMIAGGYWNGQFITVTGAGGAGKTTLMINELWQMALRDIPGYFMCLEMPLTMMGRKTIQHVYGIEVMSQGIGDAQKFRKEFGHIPFYIGDRCRSLSELEKATRQAIKRHGIKIMVFDNLHFFARGEDADRKVGEATKIMKGLAVDENIPFISIVQPRKHNGEQKVMTGDDVRGSIAIHQDSDVMIITHRNRIATEAKDVGKKIGVQGGLSPYTLVRIEKTRYGMPGETYLYYDGAKARFRVLTDRENEYMGGGETAVT